jgi:MarR family 2-MHQ and catechol resistance regulon transcriptional repressor
LRSEILNSKYYVVSRKTRAALHLWIAMNRTAGCIQEQLDRQVEAHGLTLTEFGVLEALHHKGPLSIGEIGDRVLLASSSMTYVIDKLEDRGLLRRRPSEEDRREKLAELTPEGRAKIEEAFPEHAALIDDLMADLSQEEKRTAASLLRRIERCANEHSGKDSPEAPLESNGASKE